MMWRAVALTQCICRGTVPNLSVRLQISQNASSGLAPRILSPKNRKLKACRHFFALLDTC